MPDIRVARLVKLGSPLEVGTAVKPVPGPKEVLVRVAACGLVPNAAMIVQTEGSPVPTLPAVFGLDVSGVIEAIGEHVLNLRVGDRVYVDPHMTCDTCSSCRGGRPDLCIYNSLRGYSALTPDGGKLLNQQPLGGLSEYVIAPDARIATLPSGMDLRLAARFGYVGTSFSAMKKGHLRPGGTVLINGVTGTLGVAAVAIAKGMGATKILGIGRNPERLQQVEALDPGRVETRSSEDGDDLVAWARDATGGAGVDVFLDCLGNGGDSETTNNFLEAVRKGGRAVLAAGGVDGSVSQSYWDLLTGDVAVVGSQWFSAQEIDELIAMLDAGVIDLSAISHKEFSLDAVNEAFAAAGDRPGGFTNVVVRLDPALT